MAREKYTLGGVINHFCKRITALLEKIMVKQNLSESLQQEAQKLILLENEPAVEVTAQEVTEQNLLATEQLLKPNDAMSSSKDLETTVEKLKQTLEEYQTKEKTLQKQIVDLQSNLYEKQVLTERLTKELHEAKQTALQLAESNSQLIQQSKSHIPLKEDKSAIPKKESAIQVKEKYNPVGYKKSHRVPEQLLQRQKEGDNFADNTWLYD
jgi:alanine racemase